MQVAVIINFVFVSYESFQPFVQDGRPQRQMFFERVCIHMSHGVRKDDSSGIFCPTHELQHAPVKFRLRHEKLWPKPYPDTVHDRIYWHCPSSFSRTIVLLTRSESFTCDRHINVVLAQVLLAFLIPSASSVFCFRVFLRAFLRLVWELHFS